LLSYDARVQWTAWAIPTSVLSSGMPELTTDIMAHSNRIFLQRSLVGAEVVLFGLAVATAYLGEVNNWRWFFAISGLAFLVFAILRLVDASPMMKQLLIREDLAGRIAASAVPRGMRDVYDMQSHSDQERRNRDTQSEILSAATATGRQWKGG
jgi:hypothetical protein